MVKYNIEVPSRHGTLTCSCYTEQTVTLVTVIPFEVTINLNNMKFDQIEAVHSKKPFLILPEIRCTSPWELEMYSSEITVNDQVNVDCFQSQIKDVCLKKAECAAECICLSVMDTPLTTLNLGTFTLYWKRKNSGDKIPVVSSNFSLPTVTIEHIPISVDLDIPAFGNVKSLLPLAYFIVNRTAYLQDVEITIEPNDNFMFAGNKQTHFRVLPNSDYTLTYNLYPLTPGHVMLPKLHVNMTRFPGVMDEVIPKMLPSHIFIKPRAKTRSTAA